MKQEVPEDIYKDPNDFYTQEEVKRYDNNSGMKKTQMILTKDCIDLFFEKKVINQNIEILDVGCGTGFSLEYLKESGFKKLIGIDPSIEMLNQCKKKGFLCYLGGFEDLSKIKEIKNKTFDLILSISALQWCISNKPEIEIKNIIKKFGKDLLEKLTENGIVITCYKLSLIDLLKVVFTRRVWLGQMTFNEPLQPQKLSVNRKDL